MTSVAPPLNSLQQVQQADEIAELVWSAAGNLDEAWKLLRDLRSAGHVSGLLIDELRDQVLAACNDMTDVGFALQDEAARIKEELAASSPPQPDLFGP